MRGRLAQWRNRGHGRVEEDAEAVEGEGTDAAEDSASDD